MQASKRGNARFISVSDSVLNILGRLFRTNKQENVFPKRDKNLRRAGFRKCMKQLVRQFNNTRFIRIYYHTFRYAFSIRVYHRTKDILQIKTMLDHTSLLTTQEYVGIYNQIYEDNTPYRFITTGVANKEKGLPY